MKFSKTFKIVREQVPGSSSFESFIYFEDLFSVLTKTEKGLRRFNLKRSLQKYTGGITSINGKDTIPVFLFYNIVLRKSIHHRLAKN